jgi:arabinogalactan oligomer/maltooligosaccharide transport system substrate-binding protein
MDQHGQTQRGTFLSRRAFLRLTGLAGGAALIAACAAPAAQQPGSGEATSGEPAAETKTIAWWNQYSTPITQEIIPVIVTNFEEMYPDVKIEYEITGGPPGGGDYLEVLLARIAAGNPPGAATVWTPPVQFAAQGSLASIDEFMDDAQWATPDAFFEGPLRSCQWQGKTYGLPASAGAGSIFFNTSKFEEKGISTAREDFPTTWQGLKDLSAEFVVWEGDELQHIGYVPWDTGWLRPVWSGLNGGQLYNAETNQYFIDSEQNEEWLSFWVQWLDEQYRGDVEQLNLFGGLSDVYPESAFHMGNGAIADAGSWGCTDAQIPFTWEVAQFPVGPSGSGSLTGYYPNWFVIPAGAAHLQESFHFVEYWATKGWETWYTKIMDTPAWRGFPQGILPEQLVTEQGPERAQEIHNFYADYLNNTADMWQSPVENFAEDTLGAAIDEVLHKTKTPAEALAEAQQIIQARLDETLRG